MYKKKCFDLLVDQCISQNKIQLLIYSNPTKLLKIVVKPRLIVHDDCREKQHHYNEQVQSLWITTSLHTLVNLPPMMTSYLGRWEDSSTCRHACDRNCPECRCDTRSLCPRGGTILSSWGKSHGGKPKQQQHSNIKMLKGTLYVCQITKFRP